jgi:hypothetical protein
MTLHNSTFGSNFDDMFIAIATLYCREIDKHRTPSNVISHDVSFSMTQISSLLRHFMRHVSSRTSLSKPTMDVATVTPRRLTYDATDRRSSDTYTISVMSHLHIDTMTVTLGTSDDRGKVMSVF